MSEGEGKIQKSSKQASSSKNRLGSYQVLELIGSGGMGNVYRAVHVGLDRQVALKVLPTEYARNPRLLARFRREAKSAAALEHENIVAIHDQGEVNGICYIAMELIEGEDLADRINRKGRLSVRESVDIVKQAARALGHAHTRGIIHRDIKPSNFLIRKRDRVVKLADMGLAQRLRDDRTEAQVTRDGTTVGTVDYMAPEQAQDSKTADARSDLYALGCTWYHMLTGQPPFPDGSVIQKLLHHSQHEPPDPRRLNPNVTESMVKVLKRMLQKSPADRYQGVGELLADLENVSFASKAAPQVSLEPPAVPYTLAEPDEASDTVADAQNPLLTPLPDRPSLKPKRRSSRQIPTRRSAASHPSRRRPQRSRRKERSSGFPWIIAGVAGGVLSVVVALLLIVSREDEPGSSLETAPVSLPDSLQAPAADSASPTTAPDPRASRRTRPSLSAWAAPWKTVELGKTPSTAVTVARGPSTATSRFSSLADAVESLGEAGGVLEIADHGPLFEPGFELKGKGKVVLRAAEGFHPIVVFDPAQSPQRSALVVAEATDLQVEGVHFIAKADSSSQATAPALFDVRSANLLAKACTFTVLGENAQTDWAIARVSGSQEDEAPKVLFESCHLRSESASGLVLRHSAAEVQLENSLFVFGTAPALKMDLEPSHRAGAETLVRVLSSSLFCVRKLVVARHPAGEASPTTLRFEVAHSVFAAPAADQGDLPDLPNWPTGDRGVYPGFTWNSTHTFYTGWGGLVSSDPSPSPLARETVIDPFTIGPPQTQMGILAPASVFAFNHVLLGESEGQASQNWILGVETKSLPQSPPEGGVGSMERFEPVAPPDQLDPKDRIALLGFDAKAMADRNGKTRKAEIEFRAAGRSGRRIDLSKVADWVIDADTQDVGQQVDKILNEAEDALVAVEGSGRRESSPIRVSGGSLRLWFFANGDEALTLVPKQGDSASLVEVDRGNLELKGASFGLNAKSPNALRWFVRVKQGNLTLDNCSLRGGDRGQPPFEALVRWERGASAVARRDQNRNDAPSPPYHAFCVIRNSFLVGGPRLVDVDLQNRGLFLENNVGIATEDFLHVRTQGGADALGAHVDLSANTVCLFGDGAFFDLSSAGEGEPLHRVRLHSQKNLFCKVFGEEGERPVLLRYREADLHRGSLVWQETSNAYWHIGRGLDPVKANVVSAPAFPEDWKRTWGSRRVEKLSDGLRVDFNTPGFNLRSASPIDVALSDSSEVPDGVGADLTAVALPEHLDPQRARSLKQERQSHPSK